MLLKKEILGVGITAEKKETILEYVLSTLNQEKKQLFIVTPNPEILVYAQTHLAYKDKLNSADIALLDGIGLTLAGRVLGLGLKERITGVDFIEELCKRCREKPLSMGFLGARAGVAELTAKCLKQKYPWIKIKYIGQEWVEEVVDNEISNFNKISLDILFVAYGFPKQEVWIAEHLAQLPIKAAIGVGGAFDYLSGKVRRAPRFVRWMGLEWLYRLIREPWRFKRQTALLRFIILILKVRLSK